MPYAKKRTTPARRRGTTKRSSKRRVARPAMRRRRTARPLALPTSMRQNRRAFVKLRYADNLTLSTSTKLSSEYVFRLNSIFDPDLTGTGHQPYLHDTLATMWRTYKVHGVHMRLSFRNTSAGAADNICYIRGISETDTSTAGTTDASSLIESGQFIRLRRLKAILTAVGVADRATTYLSCYIPLKRYANNGDIEDDDYSAAFGANPTNVVYGIFGWAGEAMSTLNVDVHVDFTYYCEVSNPIMLGAS